MEVGAHRRPKKTTTSQVLEIGLAAYVLGIGLGLAICVLDSITILSASVDCRSTAAVPVVYEALRLETRRPCRLQIPIQHCSHGKHSAFSIFIMNFNAEYGNTVELVLNYMHY